MSISLEDLTEEVVRSARLISDRFGILHSAVQKDDNTPVTAIDREINAELCAWATKQGFGFIGEEGNGSIEDPSYYLYADPLDGTGAFLRGMATATTIATLMKFDGIYGTPLMSVIHNPITGQTWRAQQDYGSYKSIGKHDSWIPARINPPTTGRIRTAICAWPGVDGRYEAFRRNVAEMSKFSDQQMGAFGLGGGLIASGLIDATAISPTSAVETAAMSLIVREAGGIVLDLNGKTIERFKLGIHKNKLDFLLPDGAVLAASQEIADALLKVY